MTITSFLFLGFVLLVLIAYYALPGRFQNLWLLLASYIFYATWGWLPLAILLVFTLGNFYLGQWLGKQEQKKLSNLWLGIGLNILLLILLKYGGGSLDPILASLGNLGIKGEALRIILPLGLSFLVVQVISYLTDIYRKQIEPSTNLVDFALYIAYFPRIVSGPVERARGFLPLLSEPRRAADIDWLSGTTLILVGLGRKLLIADPLSHLVPYTKLLLLPEDGLAGLVTLLAASFALYNDFAGYTSIVRGVSLLFGIPLTQNFKRPYFARSFTEFWNRWHISLSHWLRDYIYMPLSRTLIRRNPSRKNLLNLILPPTITMFISALWHGADWNMILLWGGLHGLYQVVERLPSLWRPITPPQNKALWQQNLSRLVIFLLVILAWIPFWVDIDSSLAYWRGLLNWRSVAIPDLRPMIFIGWGLLLDWWQERDEMLLRFWRLPLLLRSAGMAVLLFLLILALLAPNQSVFVYQEF